MHGKQVVSLLLAGQILTAPIAQAASLSRLDAAGHREETKTAYMAVSASRMPRLTLPTRIVAKGEDQASASAATAAPSSAEPVDTTLPETPGGEEATNTPIPSPSASSPAAPTPAPTPDVESTPTVEPTPTMEPAPTATPAETPEVTATPAVTPSQVPDESPNPAETSQPSPTPAPTAAPEVTPVPSTTPDPVETAKPTGVPLPEPTPVPTPGEVLLPPEVMLLSPRAAEAVAESADSGFKTAYVGFGYEVYQAAPPNRGNSVRAVFINDVVNQVRPELAVEKPKNVDVTKGYSATDQIVGESCSWTPDETTGEYALEDLIIPDKDDYEYYTLQDLEAQLGRIPDYKFDGWYVSSLGTPLNARGLYLWKYPQEPSQYSSQPDKTGIPVAYGEGQGTGSQGLSGWVEGVAYQDYRLPENGPVDMEMVRETIVDSFDKGAARFDKSANEGRGDSEKFFIDQYFHNDDLGNPVKDQLPIIAHWKLSGDATLVDEAKINADTDKGEEYRTETNAIYLVREKTAETGETKTNVDKTENVLSSSTAISLYNKPLDDNSRQKVPFNAKEGGTYYLRVNSDVVGLSPQLLASEAFRTTESDSAEDGKTPGLSISVRQAGSSEMVDYACDKAILNDSVYDTGASTVYLYNNVEYPMRSKWTLKAEDGTDEKYIPLTPVQNSEDSEACYNEIQITVVAPDGQGEMVYTLHVERLNDPKAVLNPGNTPYGMVERNTMESWEFSLGSTIGEKTREEIVEIAHRNFRESYLGGPEYSFSASVVEGDKRNYYYPSDSVENNSGQYDLSRVYWPAAWAGENLDLNETAVVVYQDSSFLDPGLTVYDSQGDPVVLSGDNIKRSVTLRVAAGEALTTADLFAEGVDSWYDSTCDQVKPAGETRTFQVLKTQEGRDKIDLRGVKVIPGLYTIEYEYTDQFSGTVYSSFTEDKFINKTDENWKTFSRPLVILPLPGDVDMDGDVTSLDANALEKAMADAASGKTSFISGTDPLSMLYQYRVCDVNNDGVVDNRDVVMLREGFEMNFVRNGTAVGYFYIPLHTGLTEAEEAQWRQRRAWTAATAPEAGKAGLSLEYLGKNTPEITESVDKLAQIKNVDEAGKTVPLSKGDIFWVGVKLSNLAGLSSDSALRGKGGIASLNLTLSYNTRYLKPAVLKEDESWLDMLQRYNIQAGSASMDTYMWPGGLYDLLPGEEGGSVNAYNPLTPHSAQTIMPWENAEDTWMPSQVKVKLRSKPNASSFRVLYDEGSFTADPYLLRIPFEVKDIPFEKDVLEALDVQLSMQDLNMTYVKTATDATQYNAAWNGTAEGIYGGAVKNLANELTYIDGSARSIPLKTDFTTEYVHLYNVTKLDDKTTVYGEPYRNPTNLPGLPSLANQGDAIRERVEDIGLSYDETSGLITGVPTKAGTVSFQITGGSGNRYICQIKVEKAPLHVAAKAQRVYYGEFDPDGIDYVYSTEDIKAVDKPGGANYVANFENDGSSDQLKKLSAPGYMAPALKTTVTQGSDVGSDYTIRIGASAGKCELPNYRFVYTDGTLGEQDTTKLDVTKTGETASSPVVIEKRPLYLEKITDKGMEKVVLRVDSKQTEFDEVATYRNSTDSTYAPGFTLKDLSADSNYQGKLSGNPIYHDDEVAISFRATLTWDNPTPPYYSLNNAMETRLAAISRVKLAPSAPEGLADGEKAYPDNKNYVLVYKGSPTANATIKANPITKIEVQSPPKTEYTYGEQINFAGQMKIVVHYEDGTTDVASYGGPNWLTRLGLTITWVEETGKGPGPESQTVSHQQMMTADVHHNKYLCVSAANIVNGKPEYVCWYSERLKVSKLPLCLTVKPLTVYYGEFADTMLDYTYDATQLTKEDYNSLLAQVNAKIDPARTELLGTSDELALIAGYHAPVLSAWKGDRTNQDRVTVDTPVWWQEGVSRPMPYSIYIENDPAGETDPTKETGAKNYSFVYTRGATTSADYGLGELNIEPRPIVVSSLTLGKYSQTFLFDDTTDTSLREMWKTKGDVYAPSQVSVRGQNANQTAADPDDAARLNADTFVATLPEGRTNGKGYILPGAKEPTLIPEGQILTGNAIHVKTKQNQDGSETLVPDELVVTYIADYKVDNTKANPPESAYFNMTHEGKTQTEKLTEATIRALALPRNAGKDNGNYILVYDTFSTSNEARPKTTTVDARVRLRAVEKLSVATAPTKLSYTYGEDLKLDGMTLSMVYDREGDNAPAANRDVITRTVSYRTVTGGDTFADQGLQTYWIMDDDLDTQLKDPTVSLTPEQVAEYVDSGKLVSTLTDPARNERYPDVKKDGRSIVLVGRRYNGADAEQAGHKLVWAGIGGNVVFHITPKTLPLTVEGISRFYGESNGTYRAYLNISALAEPDQRLVASMTQADGAENGRIVLTAVRDGSESNAIREMSTFATNAKLFELLNDDYLNAGEATNSGVRFTTQGLQGSDVGGYTIEMTQPNGGNMVNYTFDRSAPAVLRVYRRPITINKVTYAPVATIYWNTEETLFSALVTQKGQGSDGFVSALPSLANNASDIPQLDPDLQAAIQNGEVSWPMSITGAPVYDTDEITLSMDVVFPALGARNSFETPGNENKYEISQPVTVHDLALTGGAEKNYYLYWGAGQWQAANKREPVGTANATGRLDRRPIKEIRITKEPKTTYTYGEPLDLSALELQVTYKKLQNTVEGYDEQAVLPYAALSGRLTVNYWPNRNLPTNPDGSVDNDGAVEAREAKSGDHLTIAPVHDVLSTDAQYYPQDEKGFAHNGKYLILTAREHKTLEFEAPPVIVETPLTIKPLELQFDLTAQDRVYNDSTYAGKTAAAGAITLRNPYSTTKTVDDGHGGSASENDRDLIYVTTDVDYDDLAGYTGLADYLNKQATGKDAYTFTATGQPGSKGLTFHFYDENVVYYDVDHTAADPVTPDKWLQYWNSVDHTPKTSGAEGWDTYGTVGVMPVLVSNILLAGPDRANYTLVSEVGTKADPAKNSDPAKGKSWVPYAKMEKAEQQITASDLPNVSVDAHTNTVRVTYAPDVDTMREGSDRYKSELHYEYALDYVPDWTPPAVPVDPPSSETDNPGVVGSATPGGAASAAAESGAGPASGASAALAQWEDPSFKEQYWNDLPYFGGERIEVKLPDGYEAKDETSTPGKDDIVKGQAYPWEAEDTAFGTRVPLDRNNVYWGVVRLAETHNYKASEPVHTLQDPDTEIEPDRQAALAAAQQMSDLVESWVKDKPKEGEDDPAHGPNRAVKTYQQSFALYSTEEKTGTDNQRYSIDTLEATWFTDLQTFAKKENLDAVVRNLVKVRYYGYYWDQDHSAEVKFDQDGGLDLTGPIDVEIKKKTDGGTENATIQVNQNDSAELYVNTRGGGGGGPLPDEIVIVPGGIGGGGGGTGTAEEREEGVDYIFHVGDEPFTLKIEMKPSYALSEGVQWTSSNPKVVQVDHRGKLLFVGVGSATITATTYQTKKTASVTIKITDPAGLAQGVGTGWETALALASRPENRFDFYYAQSFFTLDKDYQFHPEWTMTRGELAGILALFCQTEEKEEEAGASPAFPDLTGKESYAGAVETLHREGILTGLPSGDFGGEQLATRSEMAAILCRMMDLEPEDSREAFLDYGGIDTQWADGYVEALAKTGVVLGTGEDYFHPERAITRQEAATMLGRILLSGVFYGANGPVVPTDVPEDHWGYGLILRSVNTVVPRKR